MVGRPKLLLVRAGEVLSYLAGVLFVGFFVVQLAQGEIDRRDGVAQFSNDPTPVDISAVGEPDTTLWAPGRISDYESSLKTDLPPVLGVLKIPSIGLEVPVYPSDSDLLMDRGSGVIDGMSYPHMHLDGDDARSERVQIQRAKDLQIVALTINGEQVELRGDAVLAAYIGKCHGLHLVPRHDGRMVVSRHKLIRNR